MIYQDDIVIEALQPNGSWAIRSAFVAANAAARAGDPKMPRSRLLEMANREMGQWTTNYGHDGRQLRVRGS